MESNVSDRFGYWVCQVLDETGFEPTSCNDIGGRGTIGLLTMALLVVVAIVVLWRRFL